MLQTSLLTDRKFLGYNNICVAEIRDNAASGCGSAWLERRLREAEVASSNPATPIHCKVLDFQGLFLLHFMLYHGTFLIFSMFPFGVSL